MTAENRIEQGGKRTFLAKELQRGDEVVALIGDEVWEIGELLRGKATPLPDGRVRIDFKPLTLKEGQDLRGLGSVVHVFRRDKMII